MFLSLVAIGTDSGPKKEICGEKPENRAYVLQDTVDYFSAQQLIV